MGGEDDGALFDLVQAGHPILGIDQLHAVLLHLVGDVGVVDEQPQHVDRAPGLLTDMLGDPDRVGPPRGSSREG